eukprot:114825_1
MASEPPLKKQKFDFDKFFGDKKEEFEVKMNLKNANSNSRRTPTILKIYGKSQTQSILIERFFIQSTTNIQKWGFLDLVMENSDLVADKTFAADINTIVPPCTAQIDSDGTYDSPLNPTALQTSTIKHFLTEKSIINIKIIPEIENEFDDNDQNKTNKSDEPDNPFRLFSIQAYSSDDLVVKKGDIINFIGVYCNTVIINYNSVAIFHTITENGDMSRGIAVSFKKEKLPVMHGGDIVLMLGATMSETDAHKIYCWGSVSNTLILNQQSSFADYFVENKDNLFNMITKGLVNPLTSPQVTWLKRKIIYDLSDISISILRQGRMYRLDGGKVISMSKNSLHPHCAITGRKQTDLQSQICVCGGHSVTIDQQWQLKYSSKVTIQDKNGVTVIMKPNKDFAFQLVGSTIAEITAQLTTRFPYEPINQSFHTFIEMMAEQAKPVWLDFFLSDDIMQNRRIFIAQVHTGKINPLTFTSPYIMPPQKC